MKFRISYQKALILIILLFTSSASLFALSGRRIMEKNDALPEARSAKNYSILIILKGGRKIRKEFRVRSKKYGKRTRSRITFIKPTRIEFLTWSQPGKDSLQWLKLTSGKVRKIASSDKGNSFVNSHFYYEDIADQDIDDYRYKYLGDADINDANCYKVQAIKKKGARVYSKTIIYLRKNDFVMIRVDFFEKGRHTKTLRNEKIQKINGIYTPRKMVMERADGKGKSLLYLKRVQYNIPVSDTSLKREAL